jgi:hypothetical protein
MNAYNNTNTTTERPSEDYIDSQRRQQLEGYQAIIKLLGGDRVPSPHNNLDGRLR